MLTLTDARPRERKITKSRAAARLKRAGAPIISAVAVVGVSVMLVITIYYTLLELQWVAFLLGVLFSAVVAMVSQTIKAQWRLVRRTAELERQKALLAEQITRGERQTQALNAAESRFRTVLDGVPVPVFFVDREERVRFHNSAFDAWCGHSAADIASRTLKDILDAEVYRDIRSRSAEALVGGEVQFEARWPGAGATGVKLLPYPPGAQTVSGFYAFLASAGVQLPAGAQEAAPEPPEVASETAYLDTMEQQLSATGEAREHLLRAIEEDHFILLEQRIEALTPEAQPNLREVLLRLQDDAARALPPAEFFEIAERYDLMPAIDRWVIRRLLRYCAAMRAADPAWRMPLYSVNVSMATLRDRGFANHVRGQLEHWNVPGSRLCFEVQHGAIAEHEANIATLMAQLKPLGCHFTVDGFGSHKVSFAPFRAMRFDYIKIDRSIVSQVLRSSSELTKVKAIVVACRKIGVQTIALFVEDAATRAALKDAGVDYVQGFGIDKPGPLAVVAATAGAHA